MSPRLEKPSGLEPWDSPPTTHGYKGGDLLGVAEHLDWLQDLGITAIYFNPVFQSAANHRYHAHDYYQIDPLLGGDEAFDEMLRACHERGIRVVLDGVFNHSSRGFFRFHDVLENGPSSPWTDWFIIHAWPLHPYDAAKPANYEAWWGLKALPKFNTDNPATRDYLMRVGEHWVRRGIDGWRLDVPEEIQTPGFWEEFRERTRAINPDCYIVGEIWGDASAYIADGTRFDATMNYVFGTAVIAFAGGHRVDHRLMVPNPHYQVAPPVDAVGYAERIHRLLEMYPDHAHLANLNLLDSHDTARVLSLVGGDRRSVELAGVLLMTFPGAPCLYYGTEIGLEGGLDPDCRRSFPWEHPERWDRELHTTLSELIHLRHTHPALRSIEYETIWPRPGVDAASTYIAARGPAEDRMWVAVNAGDHAESLTLPEEVLGSKRLTRVWGDPISAEVGENHLRIAAPPRSATIWKLT